MDIHIARTKGHKRFNFCRASGGFYLVLNLIPGFWGFYLHVLPSGWWRDNP